MRARQTASTLPMPNSCVGKRPLLVGYAQERAFCALGGCRSAVENCPLGGCRAVESSYSGGGPTAFAARRRARQAENWTARTATPLAARPAPRRSHRPRPLPLDDEFEAVGVGDGVTAELNGVPVGEASPVWLALPSGELPLELGEAEPDPDAAWLAAPAVDGGVAPDVSPGRGVPGRGVVP